MKKSELKQIIKEEIYNALNENSAYEKGMEKFKEKMGFKTPDPSIKNVMKLKDYEVRYYRYIDDNYEDEYITVKAKDEADALEKAKEKLKQLRKGNIRYDKLKVVK